MEAYLPRILLLLAFAACVALDERGFGHLRLREPLVAGTVAGLVLGQPGAGLAVGCLMTALWPALVPSGGRLLPSLGLGAVAGGATAAWGTELLGAAGLLGNGRPLLLGLGVGILAAALGRWWEGRLRVANARREEALLAGHDPLAMGARRAVRAAFLESAMRGWLIAGFLLVAVGAGYRLTLRGDGFATSFLDLAAAGLPLAAIGLGLAGLGRAAIGRKHERADLAVGLVAGCAVGYWWLR